MAGVGLFYSLAERGLAQPILSVQKPAKLEEKMPMYAITFDLDIETLRTTYGDPYNNAYSEVKKFLASKGFNWQQGSVYFGDTDKINAVTCVLAAAELAKKFSWFAASVRDIRMLRIEENNDLKLAMMP